MKLTINEEFNSGVYYDLEEQLIDSFYKLSESELMSYYSDTIETGGGAIWILPNGKTIKLDLHSDFGSEVFYKFCKAYFKNYPEYSEDYSEDDFALEDCNDFNDHLSYALGWAKLNIGTFYDDRYYLVPPRQRMTNNQFRTLEAILEETSGDVDSLLVLPWVTTSVTYYFSKHTPKSIIKSLQKFYTSGVLEESKSLQGVRLYLGQDGEKLGGLFIETGKLLKQLWDDDDEHYDDINHFLSKLEYLLDVPDLDYKNNKYNFAFKKSTITPEIREIIDDLDYYLNELDYEVIEETTETANIEYEDDIQFAYKINENYLVETTERYNGMIFTDSPYTIRDYCVNRPDAYRILYDANIDMYMLCDASLHIHWDLVQQAFDLGYYSELKNDEDLDPVIREYVADRDLFNYTDLGVGGFYDGDDGMVEFGQYLMYAIWVPNGINEDEIDNSPSSDGYDDEFEFPAGSLFTRGLDLDLMKRCKLIELLRKAQPVISESILSESNGQEDLLTFIYENAPLQKEVYYNSTFILPDGRFVNICALNGPDYGEHEDFYGWLYDNGYNVYETDIVDRLGCIKLNIEYPYATCSSSIRPTSKQLRTLEKWMSELISQSSFQVQGCEDNIRNLTYPVAIGTKDYKIYDLKVTSPSEIIKAIQKSYSSGILESTVDKSLINKIKLAWCAETAHPAYASKWSAENPAIGQCLVTALIIQDELGGDIYDCKVGRSRHFYNVINGETVDLTFSQFPDGSEITDSRIRDRKQLLANKETKQRYELLKSRIGDNKVMKEQIKPNKPEYVELEFYDLPITVQSAMDWDGNYREKEISEDYTMRLAKNEAITVIIEDFIDETDIPNINDISDEDIEKFVVDNFDSLFDKYYDKFLNKFEDAAIEACEEDYGWDDYEADEHDDYADFLYDQWRDDQYESAVTITAKDALTENWDNTDTEFIDYVLNQFNEFLKTWPVSPYDRDSELADVDVLISRFLTKGLTDEKVQQVINDMEYYLDYSGVDLDDDVDLNHGSIWDWTDKYTHYLIVEQNFSEVLDTIGYDKAKELVNIWKSTDNDNSDFIIN